MRQVAATKEPPCTAEDHRISLIRAVTTQPVWFSMTMTSFRKPTTAPGKSAEVGRSPFSRPYGAKAGWMVRGPRFAIVYVVLSPVLVVLLSGGGGGPLGFLIALGFVPALTMVLRSLAGLPVRRIPSIRSRRIRHGEIAMTVWFSASD